MSSSALRLRNPIILTFISITTPESATKTIGLADGALEIVSKQRSDLGAYYNRLEYTAKTLMNAYENIQSSESRIRDDDMAEDITEFTKNQILAQTTTSILAQANTKPQLALQLLK
jgi:flagellin